MTSPAKPYIILAAIQDDDTADTTMREAYRLANARPDTELHAVYVVRSEAANTGYGVTALDKALEGAPEIIQKVIERTAPAGEEVRVIGHVRAAPEPARPIVQLATDITADLLLVGTHRRRGLEKLMLGSVAEAVLRKAHCPVLVAIPKAYDGQEVSPSITPPCPDCLRVRRETSGETYWCERHQRTYHEPHILTPSGNRRNSIMPST